ncbi:MAG: hypothetical protein AWU57_293 [Marinobacter sp. T13-3]|nr:MAG: hypothetical protein AWU57_293 [Marinobacter sp. T13-3]
MSKSPSKAGWLGVFALPFAMIVLVWAMAPLFTDTKNVTVYLGDCTSTECALKGDLSANLFTRDYELTQPDGSVITFDKDAIRMMSWPIPEE